MILCCRLYFDVKSNWCTFPENVTCDPRTPNAPITKPLIPIDTSICFWNERLVSENGSYIKSLCYYITASSYEDASMNCQKHGMRLMRVEDSSVQTATLGYLVGRLGNGTDGIYYVSGTFTNGSWYHDDNTPIYENLIWKEQGRPESGCLILNNVGSMAFDSIDCSSKIHSFCEFDESLM